MLWPQVAATQVSQGHTWLLRQAGGAVQALPLSPQGEGHYQDDNNLFLSPVAGVLIIIIIYSCEHSLAKSLK